MNANKLILLLFMSCLFYASPTWAQDDLPRPLNSLKKMKPLRSLPERKVGSDTIAVRSVLPATFKETGPNKLADPHRVLDPVLERLQQLKTGVSDDTLRVVHIGDSHVRGHIYPQTTGTLLGKTFGPIAYTDMGVNGATCLTFTHPQRIVDVAALRPELLILSFGTNESHNRNYNANVHYQQMDELIKALRDSLPDVPILLTTPPGSYDRSRQRRRRTYAINPRTNTAAKMIAKYAAEHGAAVWDLYNVVGGPQRACKNWFEARFMRPDHVHYLSEGYVLQGELLYEAILKAYNDYVSDEL